MVVPELQSQKELRSLICLRLAAPLRETVFLSFGFLIYVFLGMIKGNKCVGYLE